MFRYYLLPRYSFSIPSFVILAWNNNPWVFAFLLIHRTSFAIQFVKRENSSHHFIVSLTPSTLPFTDDDDLKGVLGRVFELCIPSRTLQKCS